MTCLMVDGSPTWSGIALGSTPLRAEVLSMAFQPLLARTRAMPAASCFGPGVGMNDRLPTYDEPVARPLPSATELAGPRLPTPLPLTTSSCLRVGSSTTADGYHAVGSMPRYVAARPRAGGS